MLIVAFLFLIMLSAAKGYDNFETMCKNDYRDLNHTPIDVLKYCSNNLCIMKCCGAGEIFDANKDTCMNVEALFKLRHKAAHLKSKVNYSTNILSSSDENKKSKYIFALVHNNRSVSKCSSSPSRGAVCEYNISKDGSLWWQDSESKKWNKIEKLKYCIEYKLVPLLSHGKKVPGIKIVIRQNIINLGEAIVMDVIEIVAILISSFFLLLVLVVYCLLPDLRNLSGLVLMAYTCSQLFAFISQLIFIFVKVPTKGFCKLFSPVVYFAFMSSIFWLSVLSFDVWWGLRPFHIKRCSKRDELVKFIWYSLYAWGTPFLITAIAVTLDNIIYLDIIKPPFKDCLISGKSFDYYYKIPIGILIFINIVLFMMTVYNIWMVNRAVKKCHDSSSSKQRNIKFSTYAKLSVMMGLSWSFELIYTTRLSWAWLYLVYLYSLLTGVTIFYWFVCKKKIFMQLCKKFNICNDFTKKLESELPQNAKSGITGSTGVASSIAKNRSKVQNQEMDLLKNCPMEESTVV